MPKAASPARFVIVANLPSEDSAAIIAGNERVLRARLWDAQFFWEKDRKASLESRVPGLAGMVFHARLGSLGDKVARLEALAPWLAAHIPGADSAHVARAARLCKADLVSEMVGEFPELQGIMGRYYARDAGEPEHHRRRRSPSITRRRVRPTAARPRPRVWR